MTDNTVPAPDAGEYDEYGSAPPTDIPPKVPSSPPPSVDGFLPPVDAPAPPVDTQPPSETQKDDQMPPPTTDSIQPPSEDAIQPPAPPEDPILPPADPIQPPPSTDAIQPPPADPIQPPPPVDPIQPPSADAIPAPSEDPIQPPPPVVDIQPPSADPIQPPPPAVDIQPPSLPEQFGQPPSVEPIQPPPPATEQAQPPPAVEAPPPQPAVPMSETIIVHVKQDDKQYKIRIAREMVKIDHVKNIACKLFHVDPLKVHLLDDQSNSSLDDSVLLNMAVNPAITEIYTRLGEGTGLIRVVLNVNSLSKPVAQPVPLDSFMPTCSVLEVANSLKSRNVTMTQLLGVTGLLLVNQEGSELQEADDVTLDKLPQTQENTVVLNAVPLEEMQDINVADSNSASQRSINLKLHLLTTTDVMTRVCAKIWEYDPEKCILQVLTSEGGFNLDPTTTLQTIVSGGQPEPVVTAQPGAVSLMLCYFEPVTVGFWVNGEKTEVTLKESLQTGHVLAQAAEALHLQDVSQFALVQHGTGRVISGGSINIEQDGKEFELVPTASLTTIVAPMEDPNLPQASVQYYPETENSTLSVSEFVAAIAKPQPDSELALFVNGIEAAPTIPVSSLGGEQSPVVVVDVAHTTMTLLSVTVTSEKHADLTCKFRVASSVLAQDVRSHAASLLHIENAAETLLADKDGCIIDDLCAMSDMESYDFDLLD